MIYKKKTACDKTCLLYLSSHDGCLPRRSDQLHVFFVFFCNSKNYTWDQTLLNDIYGPLRIYPLIYIYYKISELIKNDKKVKFESKRRGKIYLLAIHLPFVVVNATVDNGGPTATA